MRKSVINSLASVSKTVYLAHGGSVEKNIPNCFKCMFDSVYHFFGWTNHHSLSKNKYLNEKNSGLLMRFFKDQ